jgi:hypothetical protein
MTYLAVISNTENYLFFTLFGDSFQVLNITDKREWNEGIPASN